jgi:4-amino-4-deoxy-L-arabinose transferase-like glycosyltransferase
MSRWWRLLWLVVLCRLIFILFLIRDTGLVGDEAYYWDWGREPALGYYSKPPLIGWLMGLLSFFSGGGTVFAVRFTALLLGTLGLLSVYALTRRLFDERAGVLTVLLVLLTPANAALNLILTIDAPLLLLWTLGLWALWLAAEPGARLWRWLLLGLVLGLGVLSKQMMLVFPLLMLIWAMLDPGRRWLLRKAGFWMAISMGLLALLPVLWWNQQHDWITLEHTKHHFNVDADSMLKHLEDFVLFLVQQALLYTPITWGLMMGMVFLSWKRWRSLAGAPLFLAVFSVLPLTPFFLLAMRQEVNPNWPAVYYVGLFVGLGGWLNGALPALGAVPSALWQRRALLVGGLLTLLVYLLPVLVSLGGWQGRKPLDAFADLRGWQQAGEQAGAFLQDCPNPERTLVVVLGHRYNAAQMAFSMPQRPQVFRWERDGRIMSQYEVWPAPEDKIGWDALVIYPDPDNGKPRSALSRHFVKHFAEEKGLGEIRVELGGRLHYSAQVLLCRDMRRWPPPVPVPVPVEGAKADPSAAAASGGAEP